MSYEPEAEVKRLANLKSFIEKKIAQLEEEIAFFKECLRLIDEQLKAKSFRRAIEVAEEVEEHEEEIYSRVLQRVLAKMYVSKNRIRIVPESNVKIEIDKPPFSTFLLKRVLDGYARDDLEDVRRGRLTPDEALRYEVKSEGGVLKELIIYNYRNDERLRRIRSLIRWTFEKMLESR
ncbi:MAG: hypothetical protein J7J99_00655 [Thermoprotei archaeon]|nr:hypothetical protein [Thermoprotei archaeon]